MHSYATYFDVNYLPRALSLFQSLRENGDENEIYALLLDDSTEEFLVESDLRITPISLRMLEKRYPQLLSVKAMRSKMEYIFTLTPWLMKYVSEKSKNDLVIYLDADLYFFDDPKLVITDMSNADVGIIEHKYPKALQKSLAKYGKFNVGWVGIRKSSSGMECLNWWAEKCLDWCSDKPDQGRYADQGYLDAFPQKFSGVKILESQGFNLAPWNSQGKKIVKKLDSLTVSDTDARLVFFHFHGLKRIGRRFITSHLSYLGLTDRSLVTHLYIPYANSLVANEALVSSWGLEIGAANRRGTVVRSVLMRVQRLTFALISMLTGNSFRASEKSRGSRT